MNDRVCGGRGKSGCAVWLEVFVVGLGCGFVIKDVWGCCVVLVLWCFECVISIYLISSEGFQNKITII